jgi:DUF438 domain-containing protein
MGSKKKELEEKKEKPLDRWTIKELREEALKLGNVQGVHGMNKEEIINALSKARGIEGPVTQKKTESIRAMKLKVKELQTARDEERTAGASKKRLDVLRKKISRMKRKTRV